ncbi:hypothetical protein AVEN_48500-1 [Araneus ventricosus]|uniref:Uncharacterized protein n=1 Tax=Araneus ventricosus TaxID=182803 RepID=A0A4Y2F9F1_ARAVE|nr:hypothetical protein AVEN_48500-1 [Araneus ventricosus]
MPGSLLLSNDAYSDVSEASGRSLDAKIGAKKVSFNNAVRVKQYPWKPDLDVNKSDHLTLPSNRFWFKVYKSKQDAPTLYNTVGDSFKPNAWAEENMECIHDSLAPIAEVEDQDIDSNHIQHGLKATSNNQRIYSDGNANSNGYYPMNNINDSSYYHPVEPPVDYFDEMHLGSNRYQGPKTVWRSDEMNDDRYNYNGNHIGNSNLRNRNIYGTHEILEESDENVDDNNFRDGTDSLPQILKLPRMAIRNDSPFRRSVRRLEDSDALKKRERRSRSHDDYLDNDNRFKQLKKADKSVSTEDLNANRDNSIISNRFLRGSRDMATQCYGTLNRDKNVSSPGKASSLFHSQNTESDRLSNFKPTASSRMNYGDDRFKGYTKAGPVKKENLEDEFSKRIRPYQDYQSKSNFSSSETNHSYKKHEPQTNGKISNGIHRLSTRGENTASSVPKQNGKTYKVQLPRTDFPNISLLNGDSKKSRENNQSKPTRDSATVGYLRGRQIPLTEVNTNTNRKFTSRNENGIANRSQLFQKTNEIRNTTSPNRMAKSDFQTSNDIYSRKYLSSNLENKNGKSYKNGSPKPVNSDGDNSMIDWSLSGFQLASKPDNGITSVSDSEYTVHRRPPLLMYIPGVSHHDRPAIEDDRLSALSDVSRSEINDGLSSLATTTKGKNLSSDIRRRHSMPRDGKLKWIKWKNKG